MQKFFERLTSGVIIAEVLFVDLSDGEQSLESILASRVFAAEELVLGNSRAQVVMDVSRNPGSIDVK